MRPLRLYCANYGPFAELDLDVSALPHLCIVGQNGAGKSFLQDLPRVALYGGARQPLDKMVRRGATSGHVGYEFEHLGYIYKVTRNFKLTKEGGSRSTVACLRRTPGAEYEPIKRDNFLTELGLSREVLDATMLLRHYGVRGLGDFGAATPPERRAILYTLRQIDHYKALEQKTGRLESNDASMARALAAQSMTARSRLDSFAASDGDVAAATAAIARHRANVAVLDGEIIMARARGGALGAARGRLAAATDARAGAERRLEEMAQRRSGVQSRIGVFERVLARRDEIRAAASELQRLLASHSELTTRRQVLAAEVAMARGDVAAAQAAVARAQEEHRRATEAERVARERDGVQARIGTLEASVPRLAMVASHARAAAEHGACVALAERNRPLLDTVPCGGAGAFATCRFLGDAVQTVAAGTAAATQLDVARAALAQLGAQGATESESEREYRAAAQELERSVGRLGGLGASPVGGLSSVDTAATLARAQTSGSEAALRLRAAEDMDAGLAVQIAQIVARGQVARARAADGATITQAESDIDVARRELALYDLAPTQAEVAAATAAQRAAAVDAHAADDADREVAALEARARGEQSLEAQASATLARAQAWSEQAATLRADVERMDVERATHERGAALSQLLGRFYSEAPALILEHDLVAIEAGANDWLARTSHLRVRMATQRQTQAGSTRETLDVLVSEGGAEGPRECLSGSELFRVDLALALGIGAALGTGRSWVWIDEGFGTLKGDTITSVCTALEEALSSLGGLWAITHVPQVAALFPAQLEVYARGNGSVVDVRA